MNLNLYFTECTYFMQQILRCTSMNFKYHYATNVGTGHQGMELQSIHNTYCTSHSKSSNITATNTQPYCPSKLKVVYGIIHLLLLT